MKFLISTLLLLFVVSIGVYLFEIVDDEPYTEYTIISKNYDWGNIDSYLINIPNKESSEITNYDMGYGVKLEIKSEIIGDTRCVVGFENLKLVDAKGSTIGEQLTRKEKIVPKNGHVNYLFYQAPVPHDNFHLSLSIIFSESCRTENLSYSFSGTAKPVRKKGIRRIELIFAG